MRFEVETNLYNPSALAKKFSSIQTNFDVTLGKISAIISDPDIEQYQDGHTTMNSRLSSAIQDLDGFHQQVSKMQTTYDGQFESVDSRLTTFDTTLNGITADVSSVSRETIKTDTIHYLATSASSGVTTGTYGWTDTPQSITSTKRYLWTYHTYTKGDGTTADTNPVIAGVWGNTGDSAAVYKISTSVDAIVRDQSGTASPRFVTFTCYRRVGTGNATTMSCYWVIEEYVNDAWTTIEAGGSSTSSKTRYVSNTATSVRATAYLESTLSSASRIDVQDVPIISNGADGYTVVLSNESHTFAGSVSSAVSGSTTSGVIAYKGSTRVAATIGTITGQPTGMTTSISSNGSTNAGFTVTVTTAMVTRSGTLTIPVTVDGNSFNLIFSYAVAYKGENGTNGINTATVYLYRLLTSTGTPNAPVNSTTYTFSTKTLSGNPGNSWSTTIPSGSGTVWIAIATASSNTDTDTIEANEWAVSKLVRDGASGTNGLDGYNKATITLYRRYASTPSKPAIQTVYTFSTGTLDTIPSGWSTSIPTVDANHNPCYATSVSAASRDDTYTITSSAWTAPVKIVEDGDDGIGITATTSLRYVSSSSTTPSKPTSKVTSTSTAVGVWTTAIPALNNTYKYMFTCDQIEWDNGGITWTAVVANNALTDLVKRVSEAELKITEDAIVSTVRSSDSYKGDLASKNATFTGDYVPTTSNAPASSWTTTALKESHLNDTFLTSAGELYQYIYGCYGLMITFDDLSETETASFDYVEIYYQIDETTYVLPHLGGTAISGKNIFVPAPVFWLYWKSDRSVTKYGFKIKSIERGFNARPELVEGTLPSLTPTELSGTDYPETTHPYTNDEEKFWKYSTTYGSAATLTYGWSLRSDPNKTSASEVESIIEQKADSIRLKADKISWQSTYSSMTENGVLTCTGANINGIITALGDETLLTIGDASVPYIDPRSSYYSVVDSEGMIFKRIVNNNLRSIRYIGSPYNDMQDVTCASSSFAIRTVTLVDETNLPSNYDYSGNTTGHLKEEFSNSGTNNPTYRLTLSKNKIYDGEVAGFTLGRNNIYLYCGNIHMDLDTSIFGIDIVSSKGVVKAYQYGVTLMATSGIASDTSKYVGGFSYGSSLETFTIGNYSDTSKNLRGLGSSVALYYCNRSVQLSGGSSRRFKHDISNLNNDELDPHRLLMLKPKQFIYNDEYPVEYMDMKNKLIPGFIAEEVAEIYPSALIHDELDGTIKNWDVRRIVPGMLALIQELYSRVKNLESEK